jgi:hypothetical protein
VALTHQAEEGQGRRRIHLGATLGLSGALIGVAVPVALLLLAAHAPTLMLPTGASFWQTIALLALVGALLLAVSLVLYRTAFRILAKADRRFSIASTLCLLGTLGLLLFVVAAVALAGSAGPLVACFHGAPSHAFACLRTGPSEEFFGAYAGLAGLAFAWLGGLGIALGLGWEGRRIRSGRLVAAAVAYGLVLLALLGPLLEFLVPFQGGEYLLPAAPVLLILAPALALRGTSR